MNRIYILLIFISGLVCAESIALATKVKGTVLYKKKKEKQLKNDLKVGVDLHNSDYIRTGEDGFAKYVYLDDGTQIKVHNNTEVYVHGELSRRSILKQLKVKDGTVKLDIKKQNVDEFTVITPTSVASVKGTDFFLNTDALGDNFYGFEGVVEVLNKESNNCWAFTKSFSATVYPFLTNTTFP